MVKTMSQIHSPRTNLNLLYREDHGHSAPINLSIGHPELSHLVNIRKMLDKSSHQRLKTDKDPDAYGGYGEETGGNSGFTFATEERLLQYADHDTMSQGQPAFRKALADFLKQVYRTDKELEPRNLFITNGSSQALELTCSVLTEPGDPIFVQNPTYFCALSVFEDHKLKPVVVRSDAEGLDTDDLERQLKTGSENPPKVRLVYSVTSFNNPSGVTLSEARRKKLIDLAHRYNLVIFSDEVYHLLNYSDNNLPLPMACYPGAEGRVIGAGSFSKILAPGLRMGWMHCAGRDPSPSSADTDAPALIKQFANRGFIISGGGLQPFTSGVVRALLGSKELFSQLEDFRSTYRKKLKILSEALLKNLPEGCSFDLPHGGFFLWVALPASISTLNLFDTAMKDFGVGFLPGVHCGPTGKEWDNYCRICFCHYSEAELVEGAVRLGAAVRNALTPKRS